MRDVATAGVIDNIMRMRIKEARFVIADLTHDNNGAYWEAGYAEGLGKPVIYICEAEKFEREKKPLRYEPLHDHSLVKGRRGTFQQELTATLRRSLDLVDDHPKHVRQTSMTRLSLPRRSPYRSPKLFRKPINT